MAFQACFRKTHSKQSFTHCSARKLAIISLKSALARSLRVLTSAIIEVTGLTLGPIRVYSAQFQSEGCAQLSLRGSFDPHIVIYFHSQFDCLPTPLARFFDAHFSRYRTARRGRGSHRSSQKRGHRMATTLGTPEKSKVGVIGRDRGWYTLQHNVVPGSSKL